MRINQFLILSLALLATTLLHIACQKNIGGDSTLQKPVIPVTASLSGRVTDKDNLPVSNATVRIGSAITITDLNGYFRLKAITINNPDLAFVKVEKDGFFTGSRTYTASDGSNNYVAIQLIKKEVSGSFAASSGGMVTVPDNGGKIEFPVNGIVNAGTNAAYSGAVSVSAFFINPAATGFQEMMPGALRGINIRNTQVGLQSFGMMAVELTGAGNEKLQLATGKPAILSFPIPAMLLAQAPQTIPLWSFDDTTGIWKEEGLATRQGSNYVGSVSHFSFWNCDYPMPIVNFTGKIVTQNNTPLSYLKVLMKTTDDATSTFGYGYTDSLGIISGGLPAGRSFEMSIYNRCGDIIYTKNIGPFTANANLGTQTVTVARESTARFTGTVVNCTGTPVTDGVVTIALENNNYYATVTNGSFNMTISRCSNQSTVASVTAIDNAGRVQGAVTKITVSDTVVATGVLTACGTSISEYLNYSLDGVSKLFSSPTDSVSVNRSQNGGYSLWFAQRVFQPGYEEVNLVLGPIAGSTAPLTNIYVLKGNSYRSNTAATITITENGGVGGFIAGSFSTTITRDSSSSTYPFTANFRFKRSY